jgi:8-oxo-dGTP pyrophosphatase MutT (NUDIX family)
LEGCNFTALICKRKSATLAALFLELFIVQIYKVFDSKSEIVFSAKKSISNSVNINHLSEVSKYNKVNKFRFNYTTSNPLKSIQSWYSDCKFVEASGGIVKRDKKYLWIYRNGIWDLPKGKLENLEDFETAAIREVKEECGLDSSLIIEKLIYISFHTYTENSKKIIKRTQWYEMIYSGSENIFPQAEEGIEKVEWLSLEESIAKSNESFKSIKEVWNSLQI